MTKPTSARLSPHRVLDADACAAPCAAAGVTVALNMPTGSAKVDELNLDVIAQAYRSALLEMLRAAREAVKN